MKKYIVLVVIVAVVVVLPFCSPAKKVATVPPPPPVAKTTYSNEVQTAVTAFCSPCHIPSKGGKKKPYDNYGNVKNDIDGIIQRIELHPGERGFMPFKNPRLSDSAIAVFKKWKEDGLTEQ